ncbi:LOW QUALITY PROTEIN: transmembrane protein 160 [Cariama cristata]
MGWWGGRGAGAAAALRRLRGATGGGRARGPPYSLGRAAPPPPAASDLERADAWLLRKALEGGLLSWFRNGLLASVGVISYVQSDTGRDAAYGFFILGGLCVSYGAGSYLVNLVLLRRPMMLQHTIAAAHATAAALLCLLWLCALSFTLARLEVEIIPRSPPKSDGREEEGNDKGTPYSDGVGKYHLGHWTPAWGGEVKNNAGELNSPLGGITPPGGGIDPSPRRIKSPQAD